MLFSIIFGFIYGFAENWAARKGWSSGKKLIFSHFGFYHAVMFLFITTSTSYYSTVTIGSHLDGLRFVPFIILLEDIWFWISAYLFGWKTLDPDSWVNWNLGGFWLWKNHLWVPWIYILLGVLSFIGMII